MFNSFGDDDGVWSGTFIMVPGGGWIERALCEELREQVIEIIPLLDDAEEYEIQHIVLPEFWRPLSNGKRRDLGRVLAHWVSNREVDLAFTGCPRCNRKRYRRSE